LAVRGGFGKHAAFQLLRFDLPQQGLICSSGIGLTHGSGSTNDASDIKRNG